MRLLAIAPFFVVALTAAIPAWAGGQRMSDDQLAAVTARGVTEGPDLTGVNVETLTFEDIGNANVNFNGTAEVRLLPLAMLPNITANSAINVSGSAQQNLRALVNFNAANAIVQVFLNLNININSNVNRLVQSNLGALQ